MKIFFFLILTFCAQTGFTQSFKYPELPAQGKTIKSLLPPQWKMISSARGDLNGDNTVDLAVVMEFYAAVKENRAYGDNETELITEVQRPRILAVYFKSGKHYKLAMQNNDFVLRSNEGGIMGDPLRPLTIHEEKLDLNFEGGSIWKWKLNYGFKFKDHQWQLETASNYSFHDASGEMNNKVYDFINKTTKIVSGTINNQENANTTLDRPLKIRELKTFATFKKPWTWQINPGEFL